MWDHYYSFRCVCTVGLFVLGDISGFNGMNLIRHFAESPRRERYRQSVDNETIARKHRDTIATRLRERGKRKCLGVHGHSAIHPLRAIDHIAQGSSTAFSSSTPASDTPTSCRLHFSRVGALPKTFFRLICVSGLCYLRGITRLYSRGMSTSIHVISTRGPTNVDQLTGR